MSRKIAIETFKGQPRWCLDGRPVDGPVFMLRGGIEAFGFFVEEGDEPPGKPFLEWRLEGQKETERTEVDPTRDEFRRPSEEEASRIHLPVRSNIS